MDLELDIENAIIEYPELRDIYNTADNNVDIYHKTILQQYFDDVGWVYEKNNNEYDIEFCEKNRDKLIEMNLKCVVKVAKKFRGMGLSLEELISAGNEGLCIAFEKYDPNRNIYREFLIQELESTKSVSRAWVEEYIGNYCKYGKLKKKYSDAFNINPQNEYKSSFVLGWVNKNIKKATFNSVAMMWVAASIRQELNNCSRLIKKPKSEISKEKSGESQKDVYIDINAPAGDEGNNTVADILYINDDTPSNIDIDDAHQVVHDTLKLLFRDIKTRDKRILLQKFGVGYIRPMLPKEISEREGISVARVSQIINLTILKMQENAKLYNINPNKIFELIENTSKIF